MAVFPMVNPGGKSTMLGQWRIALKQAEESARAGRLDEALALVSRPDVADHRHAIPLRGRLVLELVARAGRRAEADDVAGAMGDLDLAERHGAPPDVLAAARLKLADRVVEEVRLDLDAGQPAKVIDRVQRLAAHHVSGPMIRRMREAAEAWQKGLDDARRGEFGLAREGLDRAERLAGDSSGAALAAAKREVDERQKSASPKVEKLYAALANGDWGTTLAAAEAVLENVPEHPAARQARARAWQQIGGLNPTAALPARADRDRFEPGKGGDGIVFLEDDPARRRPDAALRPTPRPKSSENLTTEPIVFLDARRPAAARPAPAPAQTPRSENPGPEGRFLLWADAIGGYLVCLDDEVVLGRAGPEGQADVPLLGDLSRHHASVVRHGDGYVLKAKQATFINGRRVGESAALKDADVIRLGSNVELEFRQPSPVSATARLELVSRHRLPLAVDGVILMAETCIVGPSAQAHIPAPGLSAPVVLYRQGTGLWCRAAGEFEVDGRSCASRAPLTLKSSMRGDGFSFSLEPLAPRTNNV